MSVSRPQLSLWEKRDLVFRLLFRGIEALNAPIQLAWNFFYGIPFAIARGVSIRFFAFCAYYRFALGSMRAREIQFLIPPSIKTYEKWIAKKQKRHPELADKLQKKIESLPANDGSILWIGNRQKATKFCLFSPAISTAHAEVAVAVLQYTLAIAAFNQLILSGIKPNDLLIGGDSAGGNLASQPCAWRTVLQVSKTTTPAFTENNYVDMLTTACMSRATAELLHPRFPVRNKSDESDLAMAMPMDGDMAWVDEISAATKTFRDDIRAFSEHVSFELPEREAHDFILLEGQTGQIGRLHSWTPGALQCNVMLFAPINPLIDSFASEQIRMLRNCIRIEAYDCETAVTIEAISAPDALNPGSYPSQNERSEDDKFADERGGKKQTRRVHKLQAIDGTASRRGFLTITHILRGILSAFCSFSDCNNTVSLRKHTTKLSDSLCSLTPHISAVAIVGEMPPDQPPLNCAYNRDDVVAGLTQYYSALTRLAYIPSSYVDFPPPGGWTDADLDIGALRALRRSEVVIHLLRHLPYARPMHDGPRPGPWNVAPQTKAPVLAALPTRDTGAAPMDLPPDVVCLTLTGILTPYEENLYTVGKVPRNKPWRLGVQLFPVPPTEDDDAEILDPSALAKSSEPVDIYSAHGWGTGDLADFKHDECIVALQGWRRRVHEAEQKKIAQDVDDADDEDFEMDDSDDDEDAAHEGEAGDGLADAVADMEMDDLTQRSSHFDMPYEAKFVIHLQLSSSRSRYKSRQTRITSSIHASPSSPHSPNLDRSPDCAFSTTPSKPTPSDEMQQTLRQYGNRVSHLAVKTEQSPLEQAGMLRMGEFLRRVEGPVVAIEAMSFGEDENLARSPINWFEPGL
ncbi:hypothetical protein CCUS01_06545 [Colletotrichum cuscutae]|uniref:Alpha/beta hydrolase fold-3 domain-containing protein n=1 Tax=Colletotrichum cuscutae TaxID=1209917 RepID=A0AAI9V4K8_9PEZI|nr:hypothetical protein CCUS01_06545 [Colletotrichum cuscutae]